MTATNPAATAQADRRCVQSLAAITREHRCPACRLDGLLRDATDTIERLRSELARVTRERDNARSALYAESEAHGITARKLARIEAEIAYEEEHNGPDPDEHRPQGVAMQGGW
jgi:hypothetical protein